MITECSGIPIKFKKKENLHHEARILFYILPSLPAEVERKGRSIWLNEKV